MNDKHHDFQASAETLAKCYQIVREMEDPLSISEDLAVALGLMSAGLGGSSSNGELAAFYRVSSFLEDYIRTARAKGLREKVVIVKHGMRNALLPTVTVIGLEFAFLLGGLVVTEQVFNINGIGKMFVEAVVLNDLTMLQGLVLVVATAFVVVNLLVDLLYAALDPRIRYQA